MLQHEHRRPILDARQRGADAGDRRLVAAVADGARQRRRHRCGVYESHHRSKNCLSCARRLTMMIGRARCMPLSNRGTDMPKGQEKKKTNNKPKLTVKEKKAKKKEKKAA